MSKATRNMRREKTIQDCRSTSMLLYHLIVFDDGEDNWAIYVRRIDRTCPDGYRPVMTIRDQAEFLAHVPIHMRQEIQDQIQFYRDAIHSEKEMKSGS